MYRWRLVTAGVVFAASAAISIAVWVRSGNAFEQVSWLWGVIGGLVALMGALSTWVRRANPRLAASGSELAARRRLARLIRNQWSSEWNERRVDHPLLLPVRWSATSRDVADSLSAILGADVSDETAPLYRQFYLAGDLDDVTNVFLRLPNRRLIVLGGRVLARRCWPCV